ncbi:hypothetical protein GGS23DRAFT_598240 [Durotheca rogersii]|uniref:uncharacterized protein n=1 Tax=Durotheca rogersii TaxID=419775 RepID=UPI002220868B|nr:uncharacterized protein GGS23DRAFT_598240 [Durotheca rogersii]KAI5861846.1 hypothetical protein GGS23DRAFT_598240 [Durotheca rogersii]
MAMDSSSEGKLRVSKCHYETGRKRHRIPKSIPIPFETSLPILAPGQSHDSEDESIENGALSDEVDQNDEADMVDDAMVDADAIMVEGLPFALVVDNDDQWADEPWVDDFVTDTDSGLSVDLDAEMTSSPQEQDGAFEAEVPPRVATWRLNLTALSQIYNMYIVAYADKIYISRPRSCVTNALPPEPDLILMPRASKMGREIGGFLDDSFPHQVNHLLVGELGNEEILLLAYDDGDVIGYYVRHIEHELLRREDESRGTRAVPEPFFHEHVGKSAWGLAVHKQSRIIAASSNTHNVYVFVFALTGEPYQHHTQVDALELFRNTGKDENGRILASPTDAAEYDLKAAQQESVIRRRDANWRIVLETGSGGANIPNVAFSSDADGEADKVVAVDIHGRLWLMDIWNFTPGPHVKIGGLHRAHPAPHGPFGAFRRPRGWGVLVLPESSFLPTDDYQDSIGIPYGDVKHACNERIGQWMDISKGLANVRNNSTVHPWVRSNHTNRFSTNPHEPRRSQLESPWFDFGPNPARAMPAGRKASRGGVSLGTADAPPPKTILGDGSSIMRTYEIDIELRSFEEGGVGIMFEKAISQSRPPQAVLPSMRVSHERLANLIHVPELSLVVAGSLCGRVALLTLTRPKQDLNFKRGFKIEAILPTKSEEDRQIRPICPLLGVAVAPMPFSGNTELAEKPLGRRRYRLMIHYYDLRVLSYEISRSSATGGISVV